MIINALNSGANVFMADFEDANSAHLGQPGLEGKSNLVDAVRGDIDSAPPKGASTTPGRQAGGAVRPPARLAPRRAARDAGRQARPRRALRLRPLFFHNAQPAGRSRQRPLLLLPKLESHLEARLWNDVFSFAAEELGLPPGSIKATVLIETLPAAFEMDEILYELREHSAGLNCGRWDYIFSFIKKLRPTPGRVLPDRAQVTMDKGVPARLHAAPHPDLPPARRARDGRHGGANPHQETTAKQRERADKVRADKLREVTDGHDGTWVAHPGLVPHRASAIFDEHMPAPNQIAQAARRRAASRARTCSSVPKATRTEAGLAPQHPRRHAVPRGVAARHRLRAASTT